jgi:sulfate transport system substrate-binding protein
VIAVRSGNPRRIAGFEELAAPGVAVLAPNPSTSGAAMWAFLAVHGPGGDQADALVRGVARNIVVMDKGARESLVNFERGIGDAAITYEQEVHVAHRAGRRYDYVVPPRTLEVEIPAAVVDAHVEPRGTRPVAEAFVAFLSTSEGQRALGSFGFRPARGALAVPGDARFAPVRETFTVDELGGWPRVIERYFGPTGLVTRLIAEGQAAR